MLGVSAKVDGELEAKVSVMQGLQAWPMPHTKFSIGIQDKVFLSNLNQAKTDIPE